MTELPIQKAAMYTSKVSAAIHSYVLCTLVCLAKSTITCPNDL